MVQASFFRKIAVVSCAAFALTLAGACSKDQATPTEPVAGDVNQPASSDPSAVSEYQIQGESAGATEAAAPGSAKKRQGAKTSKAKQVKANKKVPVAKKP